ncbi:hypothetical protein LINGRAPRIM_LOCUS302 [Linum grandiflorum]
MVIVVAEFLPVLPDSQIDGHRRCRFSAASFSLFNFLLLLSLADFTTAAISFSAESLERKSLSEATKSNSFSTSPIRLLGSKGAVKVDGFAGGVDADVADDEAVLVPMSSSSYSEINAMVCDFLSSVDCGS